MHLTLKLRFHTSPGQSLWIVGDHAALGSGDITEAVPLQWISAEFWQVTITFAPDEARPKENVGYHYLLRQHDGGSVTDWGIDHILPRALFHEERVLIIDSWNHPGFPDNAFYTEPFVEVLLLENRTEFLRPGPVRFTHTFKVRAPLLRRDQTLALLGNTVALGDWNTSRPLLLNRVSATEPLFVNVDLDGAGFPIEYKYGIYDLKKKAFLSYEGGVNRRLDNPPTPGERIILNDGFAVLPAETWKGAGVAIPVFSLRSGKGFGIGEFNDLKPMVEWCRSTGLKLIQILPVNDTTATHTWGDAYPYSAISVFALHPIYLNLAQVAGTQDKELLKSLEAERSRLNSLPDLDYPAVLAAKFGFLRQIFPSQKAATFRRKDFKTFFAKNRDWLRPYAVFCFLRDKFGTANSGQWPGHQRCTRELIDALADENAPEYDGVAFHYFIQFHLHQQLHDVLVYAHDLGVILKGDITIGVSRDGADTWQAPEMYCLTMQAGAPPDAFSEKGQNWGFPTYNWSRMREDHYDWWKQRFAQMADYFDAFRIDHILGFFRIWSIPVHAVQGVMGRFMPAIPVGLGEFGARGLSVDRNRWVEPLITEEVLKELFAAGAAEVKQAFLQPLAAGRYALRPDFVTQRQVEQHFLKLPSTPQNQKLKQGLYDLISNVLLFEVPGSNSGEFHFRFHMDKTASFRHLDERARSVLMELYVDYFYRRQDAFWMREALRKLPALKTVTNMLICGEDLGLVPSCVPDVMKDLGLLSLEVQRMPKSPGRTFSRPSEASYLSVVTPGTHDMSTIRGWWAEDQRLTQRFYNEELGIPGAAPADCSGHLNEAVVAQHLASPAMWSIFQLQDLLGMDEAIRRSNPADERINIPSDPQHKWCYRMHMSLESLLAADSFNQRLRAMVSEHGRDRASQSR
jgi:4-alpha-glucanotransferase